MLQRKVSCFGLKLFSEQKAVTGYSASSLVNTAHVRSTIVKIYEDQKCTLAGKEPEARKDWKGDFMGGGGGVNRSIRRVCLSSYQSNRSISSKANASFYFSRQENLDFSPVLLSVSDNSSLTGVQPCRIASAGKRKTATAANLKCG